MTQAKVNHEVCRLGWAVRDLRATVDRLATLPVGSEKFTEALNGVVEIAGILMLLNSDRPAYRLGVPDESWVGFDAGPWCLAGRIDTLLEQDLLVLAPAETSSQETTDGKSSDLESHRRGE